MAQKADIKTRLKKVFEGSKFDRLVLMNTDSEDSNFLYLTGFTSGIFEESVLIVSRQHMTLLTSELEYETAVEQAPGIMDVQIVKSGELSKALVKHASGAKSIGLNYGFLPNKYFQFIQEALKSEKFVDASENLARAREVKDSYEIALMRKAVSITKTALNEVQRYFQAGMTEKQLKARFEFILNSLGADGTSFSSIVSFGSNAALPHHMPDDTKLKQNEFLLMDVGAKYKNYCADMTRTFIFKPDKQSMKYKRMSEIMAAVKEAQKIGLEKARAGADGEDAHEAVANFINTVNGGIYNGCFIHSLGHQIGIDVHDGIGLTTTSKKLKENMVVSDEPGIYIKGFGGVRFEDDVLISKKKSVFL